MEKYTHIINEFFIANGLNVDDFYVINIWMRQNEIDFQGWTNVQARQKLSDIGAKFQKIGLGTNAHESCVINYLSYTFRFCFSKNEL